MAQSDVPVPLVVSIVDPDSPNNIFVGGLPAHVNDEQVTDLLMSFGELKTLNLVKDGSNGVSRRFAFFEYLDPSVTDLAIAAFDGIEIGDCHLVVQRASIGVQGIAGNPGMPTAEEYAVGMRTGIIHGSVAPILEDASTSKNR